MQLPRFRSPPNCAPVFREPVIVARPAEGGAGWTSVIANGASVIADADADGFTMYTDTCCVEGAAMRVTVPGRIDGELPLEVHAEVLWCRHNPITQFGRHACGLAFIPTGQAAVNRLLERCRT